MKPSTIPLIKNKLDTKLQRNCVDIKFPRNTMPGKSDMYELKMALLDNVESEEFLLFQQNYEMMLETPGTLTAVEKLNFYALYYVAKR